jgi:hypothetical protein
MEEMAEEILLLGQNVDSYLWYGGGLKRFETLAKCKSNVGYF